MSTYDQSYHGVAVKLPSPSTLIREGLALDPECGAWYDDARRACAAYAAETGHDLNRVIGVLSITSPRVTVKRNVALTRAVLAAPVDAYVPGLLPSTRVALAHWRRQGEDLRAIRGDKTRSFALAIAGDSSAVVLDVWALRGLGLGGVNVTSKRYRGASATVRRLATRQGLAPAGAQAALWYGTRARYGRTGGTSRIEF